VRLALKLGVRKKFEGDASWLGAVVRTESDVRDAVGRLSEPSQRASERLFWFHSPFKPAPNTSVAGLLSAIDALLRVDASATSNSVDAHAALHDAALLALGGLACLDPFVKEAGAWTRAFELWRQLFEREEFWSSLVAADLKGDYEQPVTFGEVRELCLRAPRLISAPVAERARTASLRGDLRGCVRALTILRGAALPSALVEEYERETIGPAEDGLIEKLDEAFAWVGVMGLGAHAAPTRRNYCNQAWRRFVELRPRLAEFAEMTSPDSYFARRVFEHVASKLFRLAEAFDAAERREESLFVCLKAHALAPPGCEQLPDIEEKLRALGGGEVLREREAGEHTEATAREYAEALARELADERVPPGLFKDDPKGGKTLDSFTAPDNSPDGCQTGIAFWLVMVALGIMLQWCGVTNTRTTRVPFDSPPRMTFTPEPLNLNLNLKNYNVAPLNLNMYPFVVEPPEATRPRRRRRARTSTQTRNANERELPSLNPGGPSNLNAPRE
jgi:hypothetical protein